MDRVFLLVAIGVLVAPAAYAQQSASSSASAPAPQSLTRITFSLTDREGRPVKQLTAADIRLVDDGQPQDIISLEPRTDTPISVAILVDTSMSQQRLQGANKRIARSFVEEVVRGGNDQIAVISFRGKLSAEQEFTNDAASAIRAIERLLFASPAEVEARGMVIGGLPSDRDVRMMGASAIWESVINASDGFSSPATAGTRRAILLLTDGEDTFSQKSLKQAIESAIKNEVTIYAIGLADKTYTKVNTGNLKNITSKTGGRAFFPKKYDELSSIFSQIAEDLRSQYVVTYSRRQGKQRGVSKAAIHIANPAFKNTKVILYREP